MNDSERQGRRPGSTAQASGAEQLLRLGLPSILGPADRARGLVRRSAGTLWACVVLDVAAVLVVASQSALPPEPRDVAGDPDAEAVGLVVLGLLSVLCAPLIGLLVGWAVRRCPPRVGTGVGLAGAAAAVGVPASAGSGAADRLGGVVVVAVVLGLGYLGVGAVVAWAGRRVVRELSTLGPMVARVLPTFMIASLFFFYNAEIWQVVVALPWRRILLVVAVMLVFAVLLVGVTTRDEVAELLGAGDESGRPPGEPPLRWGERFNILLVPCVVTLIQAVLFALLVFAFFLGFGQLSVSDATIAQWTGQPPDTSLRETLRLPFDGSLVKVACTLAAFSALNFVASAASDQAHRSRFVTPLIGEVVGGLDARRAYLAQHPRDSGRARSDGPRADRSV